VRKLAREDIHRLSVYRSEVPHYLLALDTHTRSAPPFYRLIYSSISGGIGFDERRKKVKELVREWEEEVEQWEHSLALLWKTVIAPLRSLLGGG